MLLAEAIAQWLKTCPCWQSMRFILIVLRKFMAEMKEPYSTNVGRFTGKHSDNILFEC